MRIFNKESFKNVHFKNDPFFHVSIDNPLSSNYKTELISSFPIENFSFVTKNEGAKPYNMMFRPFFLLKEQQPFLLDKLNGLWSELLSEVLSSEYKDFMSQISGIDLLNHQIEASFWRYDSSSFLSVHTDKRTKSVTQLIYFNQGWDPGMGGCLQLHSDDADRTVVSSIVPNIESSVVLITSDKSWHSVSPVRPDISHERLSLQIVFWNKNS